MHATLGSKFALYKRNNEILEYSPLRVRLKCPINIEYSSQAMQVGACVRAIYIFIVSVGKIAPVYVVTSVCLAYYTLFGFDSQSAITFLRRVFEQLHRGELEKRLRDEITSETAIAPIAVSSCAAQTWLYASRRMSSMR